MNWLKKLFEKKEEVKVDVPHKDKYIELLTWWSSVGKDAWTDINTHKNVNDVIDIWKEMNIAPEFWKRWGDICDSYRRFVWAEMCYYYVPWADMNYKYNKVADFTYNGLIPLYNIDKNHWEICSISGEIFLKIKPEELV